MSDKLICFVSFVFLLGLTASANGVEGLIGEYYERDATNPWQVLLMKLILPMTLPATIAGKCRLPSTIW